MGESKSKLKQFAIKIGWDFLEVILVLGFVALIFPFFIKFMWWFSSLFGYDLV